MKDIPVIRSSMPPYEEYTKEIADLWDSRWLSNHGPKAAALEEKTAALLGAEHAITAVNGHQAIEVALRALHLEGEVITSPYTFVSTTAAIVRCGLTPVFCDIKEDDFTLDPACLEGLITEKTCAILPVHVYGNLCDDAAIREIADRHGLKVIYDAAHAFGVSRDGKGVGSMGDLSVFSFHATKAFHSIEGGLITYKDAELEEHLWEQENFGISAPDSVFCVAPNAKMNEFQAAMGLCNLRHFDEYVEARRLACSQYEKRLSDAKGIRLNRIPENVTGNYAYFPVIIDPDKAGYTRDELHDHLLARGIHTRKYFWPLTNSFACYSSFNRQPVPVAEKISGQVLTLPMYSDLSCEDVDYICDAILELARSRG